MKQSALISNLLILVIVLLFAACTKNGEQLVAEYKSGDEISKTEVINELIARWESYDDEVLKWEALQALDAIGDQRVGDALLSSIASHPYRTNKAKQVLVNIGKESIDYLVKVLDHEKYQMRNLAIEILGDIGDPKAISLLTASFAKGRDRIGIVDALGKINDPKSLDALLTIIKKEKESSVRSSIASALGNFNDEKSIKILMILVKIDYENVKHSAIQSLGRMGAKDNIPLIKPYLKNWKLKEITYESLEILGWNPATEADLVHTWVADKNSQKLLKNWEQVKHVILADVTSNVPSEVQYGLFTFISIGKREIINDLKETINKKGTVVIANAYLNCGVYELTKAAESWAAEHGYKIESTDKAPSVKWGKLN